MATKKKSTSQRGGSRSSRSSSRSGARGRIAPRGDARFVRRSEGGQFTESDDVGRSSATDRRKKAKTRAKSGYGDRGDRASSRRGRS